MTEYRLIDNTSGDMQIVRWRSFEKQIGRSLDDIVQSTNPKEILVAYNLSPRKGNLVIQEKFTENSRWHTITLESLKISASHKTRIPRRR